MHQALIVQVGWNPAPLQLEFPCLMPAAWSILCVVPQVSTLLVQLLLCLHSLRRLLECLYVSIFSNGTIHLVQYVFGLGYYITLGFTVLCLDRVAKGETQVSILCILIHQSSTTYCFFWYVVLIYVMYFLGTGTLFSQLNWSHIAGVTLFIWASLLQHQSMVLLARLRTGKSGDLVSYAHAPAKIWPLYLIHL